MTQLDELRKLLMRRTMNTIPILLSLQSEGSSIERLYKKGMLTDDMHFQVKELKTFVDKEFLDIQAEADELLEGWGQRIWQQAMQFRQVIIFGLYVVLVLSIFLHSPHWCSPSFSPSLTWSFTHLHTPSHTFTHLHTPSHRCY